MHRTGRYCDIGVQGTVGVQRCDSGSEEEVRHGLGVEYCQFFLNNRDVTDIDILIREHIES